MPTVFDDAWNAGAVLDDHFGEDFVHFPVVRNTSEARVDVNAPAQPTGPSFPFTGIFRSAPAERFPGSRGHATTDSQEFTSGLDAVEFAASALELRPRRRDVIVRTSTGVLYEVSDPGEVLHGRIRAKLTARR